jgi:NAD(P)-dependent dehydrogenase (short-subunit alcohol dehydrogenase family)
VTAGTLDGWSTDTLPDLTGRTAVVTGVTGGLGLCTVRELARCGAHVVATARDALRGESALGRIRAEVPSASLELVVLDLADLTALRRAGDAVAAAHPRIDVAVNNAGLMAVPRATTVDGFELQMGTNHLGHFAWTGTLWPSLVAGGARVVSVSSLMHRYARDIPAHRLRRDDGSAAYRAWRAYAQSKLANLLWSVELDRRVRAAGLPVTAVAAHPGVCSTGLITSGPGSGSRGAGRAMQLAVGLVAQSAAAGAWCLVAAATSVGLPGGSYVGPGALNQVRGHPTLVGMSATAQDPGMAAAVWDLSEEATGIRYP